jgi:threonine/homoserine/homoserine lactone efflux protein
VFDDSHLPLFVVASVAVLLAPGPAVLYVVARSLNQGRKAGVASVLGLETGTLVHLAAASLGISALVLSSALAFDAIRYLGAAYLVYLGVRKLTGRGPAGESTGNTSAGLRRVFGQGVLVELLDPSTALFFLAFLPQFVDPARGDVAQQTLLLGLVFIGLATVIEGAFALLAGSFGRRVRHCKRLAQAQRFLASSLFIGLGVGAALTGAPAG